MKQQFILLIWCGLASCPILATGPALAILSRSDHPATDVRPAAVSTEPLTLDETISMALANNPELRATAHQVEAAAGRARQARLWSNPELELGAEEWPVGTGHGFSEAKQTVGLAQTVPFPGKKKLAGEIGGTELRLGRLDYQLRWIALVREVKVGFYRVLAAEQLLAEAKHLVQVAELSASTAQKRVEAGDLALQEQLRAEVQLEEARTELAEFKRQLINARLGLATLLGRPDLQNVPLSGVLADQPDPALLEQGAKGWLSGHPALVAARTYRDRTELEKRRARLEPYPDLRLGVAGGWEGASRVGIVELRLSLPLPIIDRSKGRRQEARAQAAAAEAERVSTEQRLRRDWAAACHRLETAAGQVSAYRERVLPRANEALRLVQTGFEEGKFRFIDLLDTQRTAFTARLAYQHKLLELNVAQVELESFLVNLPQQKSPLPPGMPRSPSPVTPYSP